jgi:hypothetical protein
VRGSVGLLPREDTVGASLGKGVVVGPAAMGCSTGGWCALSRHGRTVMWVPNPCFFAYISIEKINCSNRNKLVFKGKREFVVYGQLECDLRFAHSRCESTR